MRVHNLPLAVGAPEQKCLIALAADFLVPRCDRGFKIDIANGPGKVAFEVDFGIGKIELEVGKRMPLGFDVMLDQVGKPFILAAAFDIAGTIEIEKMLAKRIAVSFQPPVAYRLDTMQAARLFPVRIINERTISVFSVRKYRDDGSVVL